MNGNINSLDWTAVNKVNKMCCELPKRWVYPQLIWIYSNRVFFKNWTRFVGMCNFKALWRKVSYCYLFSYCYCYDILHTYWHAYCFSFSFKFIRFCSCHIYNVPCIQAMTELVLLTRSFHCAGPVKKRHTTF